MAVLSTQQRNTLETAVKQARKIAEQGAFNALQAMAVNHPEPFAHMDATERILRNSLRGKARLLGDELKNNGEQKINHLSYELAYETWHKMLFARFLEANNLLMHPDGVAVTMEDCEELAKEEGYADKWEAAANYASRMLPAIFRVDDPLMQVTYASNDRISLESIIEGLEKSIFTADDSLGWVYQFWQSEAKAAINASGDKIDGEKLPAVTQLFTEPYMVHFLVDNTLGAWWVSRNPGVKPPVKFEYLRLLEDGTPAAGKFEGWPNEAREVTFLDPCMGSGHFVAAIFPVFAALRMHEEGLTKEQATDKVVAENLHGLELDARCTQIAAFNLALTAWKFCGNYKEIPEMNLACSGIAPKGKVEDWVRLVGNLDRSDDKARMENGMKMIYEHFQLAPELGSLLDPATIKADAFTASFQELQPVLKKALENEGDTDQLERGVIAAGIAKAGLLLTKKYYLQITNVPYLGKGKQDKILGDFVLKNFPESKSDLSTVFFERLFKTAKSGGTVSSVMPQNWLFLNTYKNYRISFLTNETWNFVIRLGEHAFENSEAAGAFPCMVSITKKSPSKEHRFFGINAANNRGEKPIYASEKRELIINGELLELIQNKQLINPDSVITFLEPSQGTLLSEYADSHQGAHTFDVGRFRLFFWEMPRLLDLWSFHSSSPSGLTEYSGYHFISYKRDDDNEFGRIIKAIKNDPDETRSIMWRAGHNAWGKLGVACAWMGTLPVSMYIGQLFDNSIAVIVPKDPKHLLPIYCYCSSPKYLEEIRKINQKTQVADSTLVKVHFDLEYWQNVALEKYPNGFPKPNSDDMTEWLFHGHPIKTENPLQVALARLMDYRWPAESDTEMELADEARDLIKAVKAFDHLSDEDGIFCIPSVNAEPAGAERLREYLQVVFKDNWDSQTIAQLLQKEGANSPNLETWLRDEFFTQHCKLFQNRPFIWHIWDGRKDGFSVLINYHKLTKDNLSKLIYTYLGDWIRMCEAKKKAEESGAEGLLSAALKLKEKLEAILEGESPYDIFVRWKPLDQQPIGWDPDLNDGVRLNIRPFMEADILRKKPNIKWGIDRGKNPPGSPWGEIRDNDRHWGLEEKRDAKGKAKK
jgi:hypothetical protein